MEKVIPSSSDENNAVDFLELLDDPFLYQKELQDRANEDPFYAT